MPDLTLFFGRFHPLMVHLPIGALILLVTLELAGLLRPALRPPPTLRTMMLAFTAVGAVAAAACGWLLGQHGGYDETILDRHRILGLTTAGLTLVLLATRWRPRAYAAGLGLTLLVVSWAGHDGGSMTHGRDYLTEAAPPMLRPLLGAPPLGRPPPSSLAVADVFADVVQPVLNVRCVSCHGPTKPDGDLRLDGFLHLIEGGENGAVVDQTDLNNSLLLQRIHLPAAHREHMPPTGRPQPTITELAVLDWWISSGAPESGPLQKFLPDRETTSLLARHLGLPVPPLPDRETVMAYAHALEKELGIVVVALAVDGPWLAVNARLAGTTFGNEQLAALAPIAPVLHSLDLGETSVDDDALRHLATMIELRSLRLDRTVITDAGLASLRPLTRLESLNLHHTTITDAGLAPLAHLPRLRRLYLWQTAVTPAAAQALAARLEDRHKLQRYQAELVSLENQLSAETFRYEFGTSDRPLPVVEPGTDFTTLATEIEDDAPQTQRSNSSLP